MTDVEVETHMKQKTIAAFSLITLMLSLSSLVMPAEGGEPKETGILDKRVRNFIESHRSQWRDWNVPYSDGKILHDLIIKNKYTRTLEIGTSTGHSAIWMAWALSKTGGRLITVEIDEGRYREALANFKEAGLSDYIDARLADAHELVGKLEGPFDFIFSDADKEWYKKYFLILAPKLEVGGCFAAHNAPSTYSGGIKEFLDHVKGLSHFKTVMDTTSSAGISLSYKTAPD
jgi:predicted O-methyltransferase YrrM